MSTTTAQSIEERILAKATSYTRVPQFVAQTVRRGETPPRIIYATICGEECVLVRSEKIRNGDMTTVIYVVAAVGFWGI